MNAGPNLANNRHEIDVVMHLRFRGSQDDANRLATGIYTAFRPSILKVTVKDLTLDKEFDADPTIAKDEAKA